MIKLHLSEGMKKIDNGNILLFDYIGNVVNILRNKPKPYRIVYSKFDDVYLLADAEKYIHVEMTEKAIDEGFLPKTEEFMNKSNIDIDELSGYHTDNLLFLTDRDLDEFGSYTDPYASVEFGYEYPIDTGSLFTKANYGKNYFKRNCPDLYNKLSKFAIDEPRVLYENGWDI